MKLENMLLVGLLVLVVGGLIYSLGGFFKVEPSKENNINSKVNFEAGPIPSETNKKVSESTVTIEITPAEFKDGKMYFDIGVNTHSVDLSKSNLKELVALEFEGKSIKPSSAPILSGHHNSGTLIFDTGKELKNFKIKIMGIPDINERVFQWP